jgi:hypothetical protein
MLALPLTGWCMSLLLFRTQKGLWRPLGPSPLERHELQLASRLTGSLV